MALDCGKAGVLVVPVPKEKGAALGAVVVAVAPNANGLAAAVPELFAPNANGVLFVAACVVFAAPKLNGCGAVGAVSCFWTGVPNVNGAPENNEAAVVGVESVAAAAAGCCPCAPNLNAALLPDGAAAALLAPKENPACVVAVVLLAVAAPAPNVKPPLAG